MKNQLNPISLHLINICPINYLLPLTSLHKFFLDNVNIVILLCKQGSIAGCSVNSDGHRLQKQ